MTTRHTHTHTHGCGHESATGPQVPAHRRLPERLHTLADPGLGVFVAVCSADDLGRGSACEVLVALAPAESPGTAFVLRGREATPRPVLWSDITDVRTSVPAPGTWRVEFRSSHGPMTFTLDEVPTPATQQRLTARGRR